MSMTLKDKITAWEPQAVWSEAGDGMWTVPAEKFHDLAARLRAAGFDFLRSLTGMDWGEEGFGAVYHLEATATGENVVLRTLTPSREKCGLPSVCDLWKAAELNEREVFDYFGIGFLNHPDMRRLFLRDDWVGYPLRKDYDPALNPLRMTNEVSKDSAPSFELTSDGSFIRKRNVLFEEDEYVINVGPQHPATHGVLRFRVSLEGEIIKKLDVHCGYIHRGIEKLCEGLTYPQTLALTDRLDYLGAAQNRHALCMCIEKGLGVEVSERVQYIRTIMDELQRIDSHLLFFACLCMDMGLLNGQNIALITDAGTPAISDPGEVLVRMCQEQSVPVTSLPGPAACITALTLSGLSTRRFCFEGFLPADKKEKKMILEELKTESRTMILYEAPHHLIRTLEELYAALGERRITLCRELTKKFETVFPTTLEKALDYYKTEEPRGEYVLVVEGKSPKEKRQEEIASWESMSIEEHMAYYEEQGMDNKSAMKQVAKDRGVGKREIYQYLHGNS